MLVAPEDYKDKYEDDCWIDLDNYIAILKNVIEKWKYIKIDLVENHPGDNV